MKITLETIPHNQQRLGEVGDWYFAPNGDLTVRISELGDWRANFLFMRHEMDEAMLCRHAGITTEQVDTDQVYAAQHPEIENNPDSFSGYPGSALQNQHNDALAAEWIMSRLLGLAWSDYAKLVEKVEHGNERT